MASRFKFTEWKPENTPRIQACIRAGYLRVNDIEFLGLALDGVEVTIGYTFESERVESWLGDYPTPDTW